MGCVAGPPAYLVTVGRLVLVLLLICLPQEGFVYANYFSRKLYDDLLRKSGYNRLVRPVYNATEKMTVKMGIKFSQLIDVDERNQFMTTNIWVMQEWIDPTLAWDPEEYENVTEIYVPVESIWHPDIVLYNNADGVYTMTLKTKARLAWNGVVKWRPPASLKSSCTMDVRYFPFDEQRCEMKFGSWTYNLNEVDIVHINTTNINTTHLDVGMDLKGFYRSVEWDLMNVPAKRTIRHYAGSIEPYPEWTFVVFLRRKFLFYTTNLIIPLVSHAFLTVLVFYLPSDSREKISLCINILLSLTVYFLMLAEIIPPTSVVVPLLAEYLLFTMILVTFSVIVTAITLNVHFRSSATHEMPDWVRKIFLYILPRILMMKRPKIENSHDVELKHIKLNVCTCFESGADRIERDRDAFRYQFGSKRTKTQTELMKLSKSLDEDTHFRTNLYQSFSPEVADAIDGAIFIANHLKQEDEFNRTKEDWKYVALVVDRIFLIIYGLICLIGTLIIICQAPMLYDNRKPKVV